tara:strand:+ start:112 stop:507 length:396 start_codon:yes stop_codon:yes gene_type:complete
MSEKKNKHTQFFLGSLVGFFFSILASLITIQWQYKLNLKERQIQLYLDEKKDFVTACENYLTEFRNWYELKNYYTVNQENRQFISEFDSLSATEEYVKWKKNFDLAYGKIFLLSDNDFRQVTMEVSTILHS